MKLKDAEDLFLVCLCEATAYLDHTKISERHLTPKSRRLHQAIVQLRNEGWATIPPATLADRARVSELEISGIARRIGRIEPAGTILLAEEKLLEAWKREQMIRLYRDASTRVEKEGIEEAGKELARKMAELAIESVGDVPWKTPLEWADRYLNELASRLQRNDASTNVIHTEFPAIDAVTEFWAAGRKTIIGANTSIGKSTLGAQLILGMGLRNTPAAIISLEDHPSIYSTRMLQWLTSDVGAVLRLKSPDYDHQDIQRVRAIAGKVLNQLPVYMDWIPSAHVAKIARRIKDCVRKYGCRTVMVDYVQCVRGGQRKNAETKRRIVIMDAASAWATACAEVGAHLILTSQLNIRNNETRPTKSNLKECGDLEEMAEYVMLLHRETNTVPGTSGFKARNEVDLIVDKNKTGPTGVIHLEFDTARACFTNRGEKET
jgi:replicative DNA helicase